MTHSKKSKKFYLRSVVASFLREAKEEEMEPGEDSLDAQIDKYFSTYESEAKNVKTEGSDFRSLVRRLFEAEDDEESADDEDEVLDEEPEKLTAEDIDIRSFVSDVMRLVENYDSLLEVRNTILRRASNYIAKNYEEDVVESFNADLLDSYDIEIGKSNFEMEDENIAPKAGAAGPMGGSA